MLVRAAETGIGVADAAAPLAFVSERFVSGPRALKGACAFVFAALGLGVSRFVDADCGGVKLPRSTPGRDSVDAPVACDRCVDGDIEGCCKAAGRGFGVSVTAADFSGNFAASLEVLPEVATVGVALVDAGTGAGGGSENQSESSSSVLGAACGADACGLLAGDNPALASRCKFGFDFSLGTADCLGVAGVVGLGRSVIAAPLPNFTPKTALSATPYNNVGTVQLPLRHGTLALRKLAFPCRARQIRA